MIPVFMRGGTADGDCLMASVASILECSLDDLPVITKAREDQWREVVERAVRKRGWRLLECSNDPPIIPMGYNIAIGFTVQQRAALSFSHACVALNGHVVHDPDRTRNGVMRIEWWLLFIPIARSPQIVAPSQGGLETEL